MNPDPITPLGYDPLCSSSPRNISAICIGGIHRLVFASNHG
jgi:hypothetical protein